MPLLTTITISPRSKSKPFTHPSPKAASGPMVEIIMSTKTREERRNVDTGRRASVQSAAKEYHGERRGSKDSTRKKSTSVNASERSKRHGSMDHKKEVLIVKG